MQLPAIIMKLKFKKQAHAVEAVADCFAGQPNTNGIKYRIDPGRAKAGGIAKPAGLSIISNEPCRPEYPGRTSKPARATRSNIMVTSIHIN